MLLNPDRVISGKDWSIASRALAITKSIPAVITIVATGGYYAFGDGGGAEYKRVAVEPTHIGKFQSADGAWWEYVDTGRINLRQFGAKGDGIADDDAAVNGTLAYAKHYSINLPVFDGYGYVVKGGTTVYVDRGLYRVNHFIIPQNVSLQGAGKYSSGFISDYDGYIVQNNGVPTQTGEYDCEGITIRDLFITGNKTKTNQIGLGLLRLTSCSIDNVVVFTCGSHGIAMYQCCVNQIANLESINNGGHGLLLQEGFETWPNPTPNGYPANGNVFTYYRGLQNDGAGLYFAAGCNGNTFIKADCEHNGWSLGENEGYNIHYATSGYQDDHLIDPWTEGAVEAHIYVACNEPSKTLVVSGWTHFGGGENGNVSRALIVNTGSARLYNCKGSGTPYKKLQNDSVSPFRLLDLATSFLSVQNCSGSAVTKLNNVDDGLGRHTGFYNNVRQDNEIINGFHYGPQTFVNDFGAGDGVAYQNDTEPKPWYQSYAYGRYLLFGDGQNDPDAAIMRVGPHTLGPRPGDFFNLGMDWNGSHMVLGVAHFWMNGGEFRAKLSPPTSATDGTVIGTIT